MMVCFFYYWVVWKVISFFFDENDKRVFRVIDISLNYVFFILVQYFSLYFRQKNDSTLVKLLIFAVKKTDISPPYLKRRTYSQKFTIIGLNNGPNVPNLENMVKCGSISHPSFKSFWQSTKHLWGLYIMAVAYYTFSIDEFWPFLFEWIT